jgi:hypothetical protein
MVPPIAIDRRKIARQLLSSADDIQMPRTANNPQLRDFDKMIEFLHWLTLFLVTIVFVAALALGLILMSAQAATARTGDVITPCVIGHGFEQGPIVNGHHRQPTQSEIDARAQELWARRKTSAGSC